MTDPQGQRQRCEGKPLALLVYLALEGRTTRLRLADLLWPDAGQAGRNNLVMMLRRMTQTYGASLLTTEQTLSLSDAVSVQGLSDVHTTQALPLEGLSYPALEEFGAWLEQQRTQLRAQGARAARAAAQALEEQKRHLEAVPLLRRAVKLQPLSEEGVRALMRAQYLAGDASAALLTFEQFRRRVHQELHTAPLPLTRTLAQEIERGVFGFPEVLTQEPRPEQLVWPSQLIGRDALLSEMERARTAGQIMVLSGEAGIGKSSLAQAFAARHGSALTLSGRPSDGPVPYATVTRGLRLILEQHPDLHGSAASLQVLGLVLPERFEALRPAGDIRPALHAAITTLYRAALRQVQTLILDDLHLMDAASLELCLSWLESRSFPVAVMLCFRSYTLPASITQRLETFTASGQATFLPLAPLTPGASRAVLQSLGFPELAEHIPRLIQFAGGNPLYLQETVRHLLAPGGTPDPHRLPQTGRAEQLILGRIQQLSPVGLQLARAASVVGYDLQPELLATMLGLPLPELESVWQTLSQTDIIVNGQFTHDLIREALIQQTPPPIKSLLHRAAARALTHQSAPPARVALHWTAGERPQEAAQALMQAGQGAQSTGLYREAGEFFQRAAGLFGDAQQSDDAFEARVQQADMLYTLEDQLGSWQTAVLTLERQAATPGQHSRAALQRARLHFAMHEFEAQVTCAQRGLALARQAGAQTTEAELLEVLAGHVLQHDYRAAPAVLADLQASARRTGRKDLQAWALEGLGFAAVMTDPRRAGSPLAAAEQLHLQVAAPPYAASACAKLSRAAYRRGDFAGALEHNRRARLYLGTHEGFRVVHLINAYGEALTLWALGEAPAALEVLEQAQHRGTHTAAEQGWLSALKLVHLWIGLVREESGLQTLAAQVQALPGLPPTLQGEREALWALLQTCSGQTAGAQATLRGLTAQARRQGDTYLFQRTQLHLAALSQERQTLQAIGQSAARRGLCGLSAAVTPTQTNHLPDPVAALTLARCR